MVRLELVDRETTFAEFVLSDGDELVFEREGLDPEAHASPSIDSMSWHFLASLGRCLTARGLPGISYWQMNYAEMPAPDGSGSCGELRVWTTVRP